VKRKVDICLYNVGNWEYNENIINQLETSSLLNKRFSQKHSKLIQNKNIYAINKVIRPQQIFV